MTTCVFGDDECPYPWAHERTEEPMPTPKRLTRMCDFCGWDSIYLVTYFTDNSGSKYACGRHMAKAARAVADGPTVPDYAKLSLIPQRAKP